MPTQKPEQQKIEYIRLSQKGKQVYGEVIASANRTMLLWNVYGGLLGVCLYNLIPRLPVIKHNHYVRKYRFSPFFICFGVLSYHGYKLKEFEKRKGIRDLAKIQENLDLSPTK